MSEAGGGNFQYIETATQIPDYIASEVGEALEITARDAVLVVEAGTDVRVLSLNDFPCQKDGDAWRVELGSLYSGQLLQAVVRLSFPTGDTGASRSVRVRVEDREQALGRAEASVAFTWAGHAENDAQPRDRSVDRLVAVLYAAAAEREALERNRDDDLEAARKRLELCARHIEGYASDDPALRAVAADLRDKALRYSAHLDGLSRKLAYSGAQSSLKGRAMEAGRQRRGAAQGIVLLPLPRLLDPVRLASSHLRAADPAFGGLVVDEWLDNPCHPFDSVVLDAAQEDRLLSQCRQAAANADSPHRVHRPAAVRQLVLPLARGRAHRRRVARRLERQRAGPCRGLHRLRDRAPRVAQPRRRMDPRAPDARGIPRLPVRLLRRPRRHRSEAAGLRPVPAVPRRLAARGHRRRPGAADRPRPSGPWPFPPGSSTEGKHARPSRRGASNATVQLDNMTVAV